MNPAARDFRRLISRHDSARRWSLLRWRLLADRSGGYARHFGPIKPLARQGNRRAAVVSPRRVSYGDETTPVHYLT